MMEKFIQKVNSINICVLGDLMLDNYISGYCERVSPEAPVPVVKDVEEFSRLGGAGNVVANIASLGANVFPIGVIGTDKNGKLLKTLLSDISSLVDGVISFESIKTTTKTRIIANDQQVVRFDKEDISFDDNVGKALINCIDNVVNYIDLVIVSDYGKNTCSDKITKYIIEKSISLGKPVLVDPRKQNINLESYRYCTLITPNFSETKSIFPNILNNNIDIAQSAKYISNNFDIQNVIITRGSKGMSIYSNGSSIEHIPTQAREVFDVSGAGDTVIATLGVCLVAGYDLIQSAKIANVAAGIVVSHKGTTPININELNERLNENL